MCGMAASNPIPSSPLASFNAAYADMVRFLARRTGNVDDARDLVHDTWLRLAEREQDGKTQDLTTPAASSAEAPADPRAYLFTVAQNVAIDYLRRGQWMREFVRDTEHAATHALPHTPDVAESLMYRQALESVIAALSSLPDRAREVFLAHRLGDEGQAAIAQQLGVSLNTVERDIMLATSRIETALNQWRGRAAAPPQRGRRRSLAALLSVAGLGFAGAAAWRQYAQTHVQWQLALESPRGKLLRQPLPDGSSVILDATSAVQMRYYADRREVTLLRGAAFFDVQRDEARPFTVLALGVQITVLGTRFGVEIEGDRVIVQVESGRVKVQSQRSVGFDVLEAGQAVTQAVDGSRLRQAIRTENAASWRRGEIHLDSTSLRDAVSRLARHVPFDLTVDARAGDLPVSGVVRVASSRDWITALPKVLPVRVETAGNQGMHIARK